MFKAGASQIDMTPSCAINLAGSFEIRRTDKVHSRLYASAVVLESDNTRVAWIACDMVFIDDDTAKQLRVIIADRIGTSSSNVFISCTHTHNGPSLFKGLPYVEPDREVAASVKEAIINSAVEAANSMFPAQMGYAKGHAPATFNRRYLKSNGKAWMSPGPQDTDIVGREGPEDQELQVIWFEKLSGEKLAVIVNFSAHATSAFSEREISADFPGEVRKILHSKYGENLPILYLQGACGNTSPINFDNRDNFSKGFEVTESAGKIIADEAINIIELNTDRIAEPQIAISSVMIDAPVRELGQEDLSYNEAVEYVQNHPLEKLDMTNERQMFPWYFANCVVEMKAPDMQQKSWPVELSVLRLGPVALAANPAELFVEYQMEIKEKSKIPVLISELTNGYCGYVITPRAWENGSYEAQFAYSSKLSPVCGGLIVNKTLELLKKVYK